MTTPDELERAVERLKKAVVFAEGASLVDHEDIDFLLSERAELLATVERMRDLLLCIATTPSDEFDAVVVADRIRADLTTGEGK